MLAGGRGERLGGAKPAAVLHGRTLLDHALAMVRAVTRDVAVVAKPGTPLPPVDAPVWHDEADGFHPRHGIATALRRADGPVLVLAVDLPRAAPAVLALARVGPTTVARADERLQPLCAVYDPRALHALDAAPPDEPLTRTVEALRPTVIDVPADWLVNVNTAEDLAREQARGGGPTLGR